MSFEAYDLAIACLRELGVFAFRLGLVGDQATPAGAFCCRVAAAGELLLPPRSCCIAFFFMIAIFGR